MKKLPLYIILLLSPTIGLADDCQRRERNTRHLFSAIRILRPPHSHNQRLHLQETDEKNNKSLPLIAV